MSFREPTPRAHENWMELDPSQRLKALAWAGAHLRRRSKRYFPRLGSGVLGVGHGRRQRSPGKSRRLVYGGELVLTVTVKNKWGAKRRPRLTPVPPHIQLTVPIEERAAAARPRTGRDYVRARRRLVLALPTDVRTRLEPRAQASKEKAGYLIARGTGVAMSGAACVPVRRRGSKKKLFLLGCHHVFWRSKKMPAARRDPASTLSSSRGVPLGDPTPPTDLIPRPALGNLDATLAGVTAAAGVDLITRAAYWRWHAAEAPVAAIGDIGEFFALIEIDQEPVYLYPPAMQGAPRRLRLDYLESEFDQPVRYDHAIVNVAEVLVFEPFGGATRPGYSGAPVVAANLLVGMHIAGINKNGLRRSYVIPAYQFLPTGIVGFSLELATDRIHV